MAAPRATQFIALRNLTRGSQQVRHLHMTGPTTYASQVLNRERPVLNLPRDVAGLRAECKRRKIDASGSKSDLMSRLNAHELSNSRAFSTATAAEQKRPTSTSTVLSTPTVRHFNSSRTLKAVGDTSAIDFAFLPMDSLINPAQEETIRIPIIPTPDANNAFLPNSQPLEVEDAVVMKPEISSMSADAVFLPMADMSDGHAMNIDFHAMADNVASNIRRMGVPVEEQAGMMKQIWNDLVDDMISASSRKKGAV